MLRGEKGRWYVMIEFDDMTSHRMFINKATVEERVNHLDDLRLLALGVRNALEKPVRKRVKVAK